MSSAVTLPNQTFTEQAQTSERLTSIVHILSPKTDNWKGENDRRKYFIIKFPRKNVDLTGVEPATS